ncbi:MAG: putative arabinose efflux permease, family [Chloroflexi bacterium]|jgi:predicted MFS family arabinose efflux permease|nr:putative arabinose efflux permease, family [Chloroflexota bacterium]
MKQEIRLNVNEAPAVNPPLATPISIGLLGAAAFVVTADVRVINPLLHIIATEFKTDVGSAGIIVTAYAIPYGLFQLVYGPIGDRYGKLKIMSIALLLFSFGTALCAFAPSLMFLGLLRFSTGVAAAAIIPMSLAYIGDSYSYKERQVAIGKFLGALAMAQILSTSLGGIAGDFLSWRFLFFFYGLISLVIGFVFWKAARRGNIASATNADARISFRPYWGLLVDRGPRLVIIAVFIEGFFFFGAFSYLGAFLREEYNLAYILIGLMLSGFGLGSLIYSRSVGWLVRRFGESGLILIGGSLTFVSYMIIGLLQMWPLFIPVNIFLGLGYYMIHSTFQTKATEMAPGSRGTAVSLFAFSLFFGQGIGTAFIGLVINGPGYELAFVIAGVALALLGFWFVVANKQT